MTRLHLVSPDLPKPPWSRWHGAPEDAWWAFAAYRDLGPMRSVATLHRRLEQLADGDEEPVSAEQLDAWRVQWRWDERAAAFDAHRQGLKPVREMTAEHTRQRIAERSEELLEQLFRIALDPKSRAVRTQAEVIFKLFEWMGLGEEAEGGSLDRESNAALHEAIKGLSTEEIQQMLRQQGEVGG